MQSKILKKSTQPIPSSARGKKRYVKVKFISERQLNEIEVSKAVIAAAQQLFGEQGMAVHRIQFMDFDAKGNAAIVRCSNKAVEQAKTALLFVKRIGDCNVIPVIQRVSGSISKLLG